MREEVDILKREPESRPMEEEILIKFRASEVETLRRFRASEAYYTELNEKAAEKIFTTWNVASQFLAENPGGSFDDFFPLYIAEEERILSETEKETEAPLSPTNLEVSGSTAAPSSIPDATILIPPSKLEYVAPPPPDA